GGPAARPPPPRSRRPRRARGRARPARPRAPARPRSAPRRGAATRPRSAPGTWRASLGSRFARLEQPLPEVALVLRGGVEARGVGQGVEPLEAEEALEEGRRPVDDRPEPRAPRLLDQAALAECGDGR